jgi:hypothetical protein
VCVLKTPFEKEKDVYDVSWVTLEKTVTGSETPMTSSCVGRVDSQNQVFSWDFPFFVAKWTKLIE